MFKNYSVYDWNCCIYGRYLGLVNSTNKFLITTIMLSSYFLVLAQYAIPARITTFVNLI